MGLGVRLLQLWPTNQRHLLLDSAVTHQSSYQQLPPGVICLVWTPERKWNHCKSIHCSNFMTLWIWNQCISFEILLMCVFWFFTTHCFLTTPLFTTPLFFPAYNITCQKKPLFFSIIFFHDAFNDWYWGTYALPAGRNILIMSCSAAYPSKRFFAGQAYTTS